MKISVIVPVGDKNAWSVCKASIEQSLSEYRGEVVAEVLPCFDLEHRGAYIARNEGLERATGDWIAWVDCDDEVEPNWASEICAAIKAHPDVDVIQFDATEVVCAAKRVRWPIDIRGWLRGRDLRTNYCGTTGCQPGYGRESPKEFI